MQNSYSKTGVDKQNDLILSAIASFIYNYPHQVVTLLKRYNFHVSDAASNDELIKTTSYALGSINGKGFANALIGAIKEASTRSASGKTYAADDSGGSGGGLFSTISTAITDTTQLSNSIGNLFGGKQKAAANTQTAQANAAAANAAADKAKADAQKELIDKTAAMKLAQGKSSSTGLYIGLAIGAVVLIGGLLFILKMTKKTSTAPAAAPAV